MREYAMMRSQVREEDVAKMIRQVLSALTYMHSLGIVHRDLKLENIMLVEPFSPSSSASSRIKLIDFGSACRSDQRLSVYIQSRFYRSPEVLLGCEYGERPFCRAILVLSIQLRRRLCRRRRPR